MHFNFHKITNASCDDDVRRPLLHHLSPRTVLFTSPHRRRFFSFSIQSVSLLFLVEWIMAGEYSAQFDGMIFENWTWTDEIPLLGSLGQQRHELNLNFKNKMHHTFHFLFFFSFRACWGIIDMFEVDVNSLIENHSDLVGVYIESSPLLHRFFFRFSYELLYFFDDLIWV